MENLHLQIGTVCVLNMILIFYTIRTIQEEEEVSSKKRKEYLKTIRELEKMSERDLSDIGLSRGEIKARALMSIYKINI